MFPFIINYKDIQIPTFFFMVMVASLVATFYMYWLSPKKGLSQIVVLDISLWGTVCGVIGARVFHILFEYPQYYWEHPTYVFHFWQGGFVGYGVFIGITISSIIYLKLKKLSVLQYGDLIVLACPLIIFFVRVGCIGAGCCYGKETDFFIHMVFHNRASDAGSDFPGVSLHATQIYDMINAILVFITIHILYKRKQFHGQVILVFFMMYGALRFFIEFLRGDEDRGVYLDGALSTSQIVGIVIWIVGSILYWYFKKTQSVKPATS